MSLWYRSNTAGTFLGINDDDDEQASKWHLQLRLFESGVCLRI